MIGWNFPSNGGGVINGVEIFRCKEIPSLAREICQNSLDAAADEISRLKFSKTSVLQISDFNTTGLAEPFNPCAMQGWNTLTKINGGEFN